MPIKPMRSWYTGHANIQHSLIPNSIDQRESKSRRGRWRRKKLEARRERKGKKIRERKETKE